MKVILAFGTETQVHSHNFIIVTLLANISAKLVMYVSFELIVDEVYDRRLRIHRSIVGNAMSRLRIPQGACFVSNLSNLSNINVHDYRYGLEARRISHTPDSSISNLSQPFLRRTQFD